MTSHVLIKLDHETVIGYPLRNKVDPRAFERRLRVLIEQVGVVVRSLVRVADVEFVVRIVIALGKRRWCAD